MDEDLSGKTRDELAAEVRRLRDGIRAHRDSTGHVLCWYRPQFHIFTSHAQPWDPIDSQATRHEQYAPE